MGRWSTVLWMETLWVSGACAGQWGGMTFLHLLRAGVRESAAQFTNHRVTFPLWAAASHAFVTGL